MARTIWTPAGGAPRVLELVGEDRLVVADDVHVHRDAGRGRSRGGGRRPGRASAAVAGRWRPASADGGRRCGARLGLVDVLVVGAARTLGSVTRTVTGAERSGTGPARKRSTLAMARSNRCAGTERIGRDRRPDPSDRTTSASATSATAASVGRGGWRRIGGHRTRSIRSRTRRTPRDGSARRRDGRRCAARFVTFGAA